MRGRKEYMNNIPDTELMAEKLGMIVLCQNCGQRLKRDYVARIPCWRHELNNDYYYCLPDYQIANDNRLIWKNYAKTRPSELVDAYDMEPQ